MRESCLTRLIAIAPAKCNEILYGVLSGALVSTNIYYSNKLIIAGFCKTYAFPNVEDILLNYCPEIFIEYRRLTMVVPFPYEYYDPINDKWEGKPNKEFFSILEKIRLLLRTRLQSRSRLDLH